MRNRTNGRFLSSDNPRRNVKRSSVKSRLGATIPSSGIRTSDLKCPRDSSNTLSNNDHRRNRKESDSGNVKITIKNSEKHYESTSQSKIGRHVFVGNNVSAGDESMERDSTTFEHRYKSKCNDRYLDSRTREDSRHSRMSEDRDDNVCKQYNSHNRSDEEADYYDGTIRGEEQIYFERSDYIDQRTDFDHDEHKHDVFYPDVYRSSANDYKRRPYDSHINPQDVERDYSYIRPDSNRYDDYYQIERDQVVCSPLSYVNENDRARDWDSVRLRDDNSYGVISPSDRFLDDNNFPNEIGQSFHHGYHERHSNILNENDRRYEEDRYSPRNPRPETLFDVNHQEKKDVGYNRDDNYNDNRITYERSRGIEQHDLYPAHEDVDDYQDFDDRQQKRSSDKDFDDRHQKRKSYKDFDDRHQKRTSYKDSEDRQHTRRSYEDFDNRQPERTSREDFDDRQQTRTSYQDFDDRQQERTSREDFDDRKPKRISREEFDDRQQTRTSYQDFDNRYQERTSHEDFGDRKPKRTSREDIDDRQQMRTSYQDFDDGHHKRKSHEDFHDRKPKRTFREDFDDQQQTRTSYEDGDDRQQKRTSHEELYDRQQKGTSYEDLDDRQQKGTFHEDLDDRQHERTYRADFDERQRKRTSREDFDDRQQTGTSHEDFDERQHRRLSHEDFDNSYCDSSIREPNIAFDEIRQTRSYESVVDLSSFRRASKSRQYETEYLPEQYVSNQVYLTDGQHLNEYNPDPIKGSEKPKAFSSSATLNDRFDKSPKTVVGTVRPGEQVYHESNECGVSGNHDLSGRQCAYSKQERFQYSSNDQSKTIGDDERISTDHNSTDSRNDRKNKEKNYPEQHRSDIDNKTSHLNSNSSVLHQNNHSSDGQVGESRSTNRNIPNRGLSGILNNISNVTKSSSNSYDNIVKKSADIIYIDENAPGEEPNNKTKQKERSCKDRSKSRERDVSKRKGHNSKEKSPLRSPYRRNRSHTRSNSKDRRSPSSDRKLRVREMLIRAGEESVTQFKKSKLTATLLASSMLQYMQPQSQMAFINSRIPVSPFQLSTKETPVVFPHTPVIQHVSPSHIHYFPTVVPVTSINTFMTSTRSTVSINSNNKKKKKKITTSSCKSKTTNKYVSSLKSTTQTNQSSTCCISDSTNTSSKCSPVTIKKATNIPRTPKNEKPWFDEACMKLRRQRKIQVKKLHRAQKKPARKDKIKELRGTFKKLNVKYEALLRARRAQYLDELDAKGDTEEICRSVTGTLVDKVVSYLKMETEGKSLAEDIINKRYMIGKSALDVEAAVIIVSSDEDIVE